MVKVMSGPRSDGGYLGWKGRILLMVVPVVIVLLLFYFWMDPIHFAGQISTENMTQVEVRQLEQDLKHTVLNAIYILVPSVVIVSFLTTYGREIYDRWLK